MSYIKASTLKTYFYQGLSMLSDGASTFLDGAGLDEHLQADTPLGSQAYLNDHLGSTSQLLDALNGGSNKAKYDYTSYGKLEGDLTNPSASNPYTYTGREDDGTGLMYYRARYYDPELEVFISQDPLGDAQRYVKGNPLKSVDPFGLYDVAFFHNPTILPGDPGHPAIVMSQNGKVHLYYKTINQTGEPGVPYQGDLYEFNNKNWIPGGIDIYHLDPNIFKNEDVPGVRSEAYGPLPINGYASNCSSYAASVLNTSIREKNMNLKPGEKPYVEVDGTTPFSLYDSLIKNGYIKLNHKINIPN